jgi:hypothetical protein
LNDTREDSADSLLFMQKKPVGLFLPPLKESAASAIFLLNIKTSKKQIFNLQMESHLAAKDGTEALKLYFYGHVWKNIFNWLRILTTFLKLSFQTSAMNFLLMKK